MNSAAEWEQTARKVEAVINNPPSPEVMAWIGEHSAKGIHPVPNPSAQVHYWIAEGIRAHTSMTEAEAQSSAQALLDQYNHQPQR